MNKFSIAMKQILQLTTWLVCLLALATPAKAGGWELVRYEQQAQYDNTDIALGYGQDGVTYFPATELHHNQTTRSWSDGEEVITVNGEPSDGSGARDGVQLWWNNGRPTFKAPGKRGAQPTQSVGTLSITPVFRWKRAQTWSYFAGYQDDPDDNPPDILYYTETASVSGNEFIRQWDGNAVPYSSQNQFGGKYFTFSNVSHPFGGVGSVTTTWGGYYASHWFNGNQGGQRTTALAVGKKDEVRGETRTFGGTIEINAAYDKESTDTHGAASLSFGYSAAPATFQLDVSAPGLQWRNTHPTKKELDAYASRSFDGTEDPESPIVTKWLGPASYTATASSNLLSQMGTPEYRWTLSNNTGPNYGATPNQASVQGNHLLQVDGALEEGTSSTAELVIAGTQGNAEDLTASATINWHRAPYTQYRAEVETEVIDYNTGQTTKLSDVTSGSNPLETEEERALDEFTADYEAMETEFVTTGAQLVGSALEAEMMVGSWFVPDEVDVATGGLTLAGKPLKKLYKVGKTFKATVEVAARINRVRDKLVGATSAVAKKLGHGDFVIVMKRKKFRETRGGHIGPNGKREPAKMGEVKEEEEILCSVSGPACFVKGTLVDTQNGHRAIEMIKKGDLIWSRDEATGATELKRVTQTFERQSATLALTFSNGERIETTAGHPFYIENSGFRAASEIGIGTSIVTRAGPSVQVVSTQRGKLQTVYNIEVEEFHTYFVGHSTLWVHNLCTRTPPRIEDGNLREGWIHIDARHITGNHPGGAGDLFAAGTTRAQLDEVAADMVKNGKRTTDPRNRMQIFEMRKKINGQRDVIRLYVDSEDGNRVITMFPIKSE